MTEPQVWALIGAFATTLAVLATVMLAMMRMLGTGLREEMRLGFAAVDARFDVVDQRFDTVDTRIDGLEKRMDGLDKRIDGLDKRIDGLDARIGRVETKLEHVERDITTLFRRDIGDAL